MRSIMEVVLRDHYGANGEDLSLCDRISRSRKLLPNGASAEELHRLRMVANSILHLDPGNEVATLKLDPVHLEIVIVSLLKMLRALIEGAPQRPPVLTRYVSHR